MASPLLPWGYESWKKEGGWRSRKSRQRKSREKDLYEWTAAVSSTSLWCERFTQNLAQFNAIKLFVFPKKTSHPPRVQSKPPSMATEKQVLFLNHCRTINSTAPKTQGTCPKLTVKILNLNWNKSWSTATTSGNSRPGLPLHAFIEIRQSVFEFLKGR